MLLNVNFDSEHLSCVIFPIVIDVVKH